MEPQVFRFFVDHRGLTMTRLYGNISVDLRFSSLALATQRGGYTSSLPKALPLPISSSSSINYCGNVNIGRRRLPSPQASDQNQHHSSCLVQGIYLVPLPAAIPSKLQTDPILPIWGMSNALPVAVRERAWVLYEILQWVPPQPKPITRLYFLYLHTDYWELCKEVAVDIPGST